MRRVVLLKHFCMYSAILMFGWRKNTVNTVVMLKKMVIQEIIAVQSNVCSSIQEVCW